MFEGYFFFQYFERIAIVLQFHCTVEEEHTHDDLIIHLSGIAKYSSRNLKHLRTWVSKMKVKAIFKQGEPHQQGGKEATRKLVKYRIR